MTHITVTERPHTSKLISVNWKNIIKEKDDKPFSLNNSTTIKTENITKGKTSKYVGIDCEFVGVGFNGQDNSLARVALVNQDNECIYDSFVQPQELITDFRYDITGIKMKDLKNGNPFKQVQAEVAVLIDGKILVGHAIKNDLKTLFLTHPRTKIRDTAKYHYFQKIAQTKYPSLKKLAKLCLNIDIQKGSHNPIEDAQTAMALFLLRKKTWEHEIKVKSNSWD